MALASTEPPPPPPLPLVETAPTQELSPYQVKLPSAPSDYLTNIPPPPPNPPPYEPTYYFFYGTLASAEKLQQIGLPAPPTLERSHIVGYELAKWGDYFTLLDGRPGDRVDGRAYLVRSAEDERRLARCETLAYREAPCWIGFEDGREGMGKVFMYAGDPKALKEGRHDKVLWRRQWETGR